MADSGKGYRLSFKTEKENVHINVEVSWEPSEVSSLCVMVFQPHFKLWNLWIIRDLETCSEWTADRTVEIGLFEGIEVLVYGMTSEFEDHHGDHFKVLSSASTTVCTVSGQCGRIMKLQKHHCFQGILMKNMGLATLCRVGSFRHLEFPETSEDKFNVKPSFVPPDSYRLDLQDETFLGQRDTILFLGQDNTEYLVLTKMSKSGVDVTLSLPSRKTYQGVVIEMVPDMTGFKAQRTASFNMKTVMTKTDLTELKKKAETFVEGYSTHEVQVMFRNKPEKKMNEIMEEHNGLMKKYIKDNNGDPYSPVNGNIQGLFFSVSLDRLTGELPNFSYFGDRRLIIPVEALFKSDTNLYFTDFYCHNRAHYVTLILTVPQSDTDVFCQESLLLLDQSDNPFLFREDGEVHTTTRLHVEVLYTEDVDIKRLQAEYGEDEVRFTFTRSMGIGQSLPNGIPKKRHCPVCNL